MNQIDDNINNEPTERAPDTTGTRLPIDIDGFSGPLELLVNLIAKHEMDICSVNISTITETYIKIIREWEVKDLDLAGEYLVLASTLIRYKSRALIPKEESEPEDEELADQILELRRQEYERFRKLAEELRNREEESSALFPRLGSQPEGVREVVEYTEVSVYDLYRTFQKIIEEIGTQDINVVEGETYSVDEKMLEIEALIEYNDKILLQGYLKTLRSKIEIVVVFLALLEMIRLHEVLALQEEIHGEIFLQKGEHFKTVQRDEPETEE